MKKQLSIKNLIRTKVMLALAGILMIGFAFSVNGAFFIANYENQISAKVISEAGNQIRIMGTAAGTENGNGLPGDLMLSLHYNPATSEVMGGHWQLMAKEDATTSNAAGTVLGKVSGGTVTFENERKVVAVKDIRLEVKGGNGRFGGVSGGNGSFEVKLGSQTANGAPLPQGQANDPEQFRGTMSLNF